MKIVEISGSTDLEKRKKQFEIEWNVKQNYEHEKLKNRVLNVISYYINIATEKAAGYGYFQKDYLNDICDEIGYMIGIDNKKTNTSVFEYTYIYEKMKEFHLNNNDELVSFLFITQEIINNNLIKECGLQEEFAKKIAEAFCISNSNFKIIKEDKTYKIINGSEKFLDESLIIENLSMMVDYEDAGKHYLKAVQMDKNENNKRNIIDELRLSLELLLKRVFNNEKSIENQMSNIGSYLESNGVNKTISNMYYNLLDCFTKYNNDNVKHGDNINEIEINYMIYLTGTFIYMITNIEQSKKEIK